jgi:LytS/YehU family sensor histidine kinase
MKYSFSTSDHEVNGKVLLKDEISYVEKVIKMNSLRFNEHFHVTFNASGVGETDRIIPFVLITIVENALKYGEVTDANHPVTFNLEISNGELNFEGSNKKRNLHTPVPSTGLGMSNMISRLKKRYADRFELKVTETADVYSVKLKIPLH